MKPIIASLLLLLSTTGLKAQDSVPAGFHDFTVSTLEGKSFDFSTLRGKKVMVVNTASKCGLTPQYEGLQKLYDTYKDQDFVIIGFPANDFMNQEPGSADEIRSFCTDNYQVTFPLMEKISVKGKDMHPVYQWLTQKKYNHLEDSKVTWNFQKYLLDENGQLAKVLSPRTKPNDPEIINWIQQ